MTGVGRAGLLCLGLVLLAACQTGGDGLNGPTTTTTTCWWEKTCFETTESADGRAVRVILDYKGSEEPFTIELRTTQSGMDGRWQPKQTHIVQKPERIEILTLRAPPTGAYDWRWRFERHPGTTAAAHDGTVLYRLPYPAGRTFEVIQAYGGTFSHSGNAFYSIDWDMPVGTPVLAARGGVVVATRADSDRRGRRWENHIYIRHDDGTYGWYLHLRQGGVGVAVGQAVRAGEVIGYSGNTGYSSRPHLHFQVSALSGDADEFYRSFPTRFVTSQGIVSKLRNGARYQAVPLPEATN